MNKSAHHQTASSKRWQWPINLGKYDRNVSLSANEIAALASFVSKNPELGSRSGKSMPHQIRIDLRRITLPIEDALNVIRTLNEESDNPSIYSQRVRGNILSMYLWVTHKLQRTFWGWSREEWLNNFFGQGSIRPYPIRRVQQTMLATSYLLTDRIDNPRACLVYQSQKIARKVFGRTLIDTQLERVNNALSNLGYGVSSDFLKYTVPRVLCDALLLNRSGFIEDLTFEMLSELREQESHEYAKAACYTLSNALASLGVIAQSLVPCRLKQKQKRPGTLEGISPEWVGWVDRWYETSTLSKRTGKNHYYVLLKVGRWLKANHPDVVSPEQWTRDLALDFVSAVLNLKYGQWASPDSLYRIPPEKINKPFTPRAKRHYLMPVRVFFSDCQEWEWIPVLFNPWRYLKTPVSVQSLIGPNPRVIADDIWAKLLWAGLNLTSDDLPRMPNGGGWVYPVEMVRAIVIVWLFAGLRSDEIYRLPMGCIRWQRGDVVVPATGEVLPKDAVCWLDVPVNKTSLAFTKPVDRVVGEAVEIWERIRPEQPKALDDKTGEMVNFLFSYRARRIGKEYINRTIIPHLCHKAGVPTSDATGRITSHRARSTITSQLYNSEHPMSLDELRAWLGHKHMYSTDYYAAKTPTRVAKAFYEAGYFERNLRTIKVLIDRDAVISGAAASGEPWQYFDLGHGYCTYDFFTKCPHRMACAKCAFYLPKNSTKAQFLEAKSNLQNMLISFPLTDEEREAVEEGIECFSSLIETLADVPTPAGPTPRDLVTDRRQLPVITLTEPEDDS